eukprot:4606395-Pleurochrysis_carterae.AAC.1
MESWHDATIAQKAFATEKVEEFMRLTFFDALSSSSLLKCDHQYKNQAEEELRAQGSERSSRG